MRIFMRILNILDLRKANLTKIVQFQEKFELEIPIWANFVSLDKREDTIEIYCWEEEPYYDKCDKCYCQNVSYQNSEYEQLQYSVITDGEFEPVCEKVKTIYEVRKDVLNMNIEQWQKYDILFLNYRGTAEWFLTNIGLPGSLSAKCNEQETEFFDEIYRLYREINT